MSVSPFIQNRSEQILELNRNLSSTQFDKVFRFALPIQWIVGVFVIWWIYLASSPQYGFDVPFTWITVIGSILIIPGIWFSSKFAGTSTTKLWVILAQMSLTEMLILLSGNRAEVHAYLFISLGILGLYHNWKFLLGASGFAIILYALGNFLTAHFLYPHSTEALEFVSSTTATAVGNTASREYDFQSHWYIFSSWLLIANIVYLWEYFEVLKQWKSIALSSARTEHFIDEHKKETESQSGNESSQTKDASAQSTDYSLHGSIEEIEQRFRALMRASAQIVWTTNDQGEAIKDWPEWRIATGQSFEDIRGIGWLNAVHPDDRQPVEDAWRKGITSRKFFELEFRAHTMGGSSWRYYLCRGVPIINPDGHLTEWVGTMADISDRKLAELEVFTAHSEVEARIVERTVQLTEANQLLQEYIADRIRIESELAEARDAALHSNELKSQFLATVSHEIRTPMNGIIGMTSLLSGTPMTSEQEECVTMILQSSDGLMTIINDILDFSKMEAGRFSIEEIDFDILKTLNDAVDFSLKSAESKHLSLIRLVNSDVCRHVKGDPGRLRQVLLNLLSNAIKFTSDGSVTARVFNVNDTKETVTLCFQILDSGIGISSEAIGDLFQPFVQGDGTMSRKYGGTGLGLAICKQIVELMGGEMGVISKESIGSNFWFTITLKKISTDSQQDKPDKQNNDSRPRKASEHISIGSNTFTSSKSEGAAASKVRILVAEDNLIDQKVLLQKLQKLGYQPDSVTDGKKAFDSNNRFHYDLILMDSEMPEMDGFAAAEKIRLLETAQGIAPEKQVPIVAMLDASESDDAELKQPIPKGFNAFLRKPIELEVLKKAIEDWAKH